MADEVAAVEELNKSNEPLNDQTNTEQKPKKKRKTQDCCIDVQFHMNMFLLY